MQANWGWKNMYGPGFEILRRSVEIDKNYYPESMHRHAPDSRRECPATDVRRVVPCEAHAPPAHPRQGPRPIHHHPHTRGHVAMQGYFHNYVGVAFASFSQASHCLFCGNMQLVV